MVQWEVYEKMNKETIVCCDIDGTLIQYNSKGKDVPRYEVISLLKMFSDSFNCKVYLWSGGGCSYAESWAEKLGLEFKVIEKGSIVPDIAVDDEDVELGKVNIKI